MNHDLWPHITRQQTISVDGSLAIVAERERESPEILSDNFCCAQLMGFMTDTAYITGRGAGSSSRVLLGAHWRLLATNAGA